MKIRGYKNIKDYSMLICDDWVEKILKSKPDIIELEFSTVKRKDKHTVSVTRYCMKHFVVKRTKPNLIQRLESHNPVMTYTKMYDKVIGFMVENNVDTIYVTFKKIK